MEVSFVVEIENDGYPAVGQGQFPGVMIHCQVRIFLTLALLNSTCQWIWDKFSNISQKWLPGLFAHTGSAAKPIAQASYRICPVISALTRFSSFLPWDTASGSNRTPHSQSFVHCHVQWWSWWTPI